MPRYTRVAGPGHPNPNNPKPSNTEVSLTESTENGQLMGVYERCDTKAPGGSPMYVNHNAGDDTKPKRYLYRGDASTHGGTRDGLWIACNEESEIATNQGNIRSVAADAELPTAAGLTWVQAKGMIVTEVRLGARRCTLDRFGSPPFTRRVSRI